MAGGDEWIGWEQPRNCRNRTTFELSPAGGKDQWLRCLSAWWTCQGTRPSSSLLVHWPIENRRTIVNESPFPFRHRDSLERVAFQELHRNGVQAKVLQKKLAIIAKASPLLNCRTVGRRSSFRAIYRNRPSSRSSIIPGPSGTSDSSASHRHTGSDKALSINPRFIEMRIRSSFFARNLDFRRPSA